MPSQFTWVPIYQELADVLVDWQHRQKELIVFLENLRDKGLTITPLQDIDKDGARFLFEEIDPFTFFGVFNRRISPDQRMGIIAEIKTFFNLQKDIPTDFQGIPLVHNMTSRFIDYQRNRGFQDTDKLWRVFRLALGDSPLDNPEFHQAFDEAIGIKGINVNLTIGLFWIRPNDYLNLDQVNRDYLDIDLPKTGLTTAFYVDTVKAFQANSKSFPELSHEAWLSKQAGEPINEPDRKSEFIEYWLVGAYWDSRDPSDQTERFISEGVWVNGYEDKFIEEVQSMNVGDKIAIKSAYTQKRDLPFNNRNNTVSCMAIKAIGTIVANRGDGRVVEVEWDPDFQPKIWYFYTFRGTVWQPRKNTNPKWQEAINQMIDFAWYGKEQNIEYFVDLWWGDESEDEEFFKPTSDLDVPEPYSVDDMIDSGVFLTRTELEEMLEKLMDKKAVILQGPPGVGKTFIARKLAFALMQEKDLDRLEFVQFHQSYSYDDFIRGYRPSHDEAGLFKLQDGVFFDFCDKARNDPDREYVFIIDEINRGNLSQIFGEVLMLIEHDKRGKEFSVPLVYRQQDEPRFFVPSNLYLMGLMNLADRSLAMVDYALRRRFGFITLLPQFSSDIYRHWLTDRSMKPDLIDLIIQNMSELNRVIYEDSVLGENYQIGHSYFCPRGDDFSGLDKKWYLSIVRTEIIPLLKEYWFDNQGKVNEAVENLLL